MGLPDVTRVADIQYAPGGKRHRLDVYHRADRPAGAPVLFQIHGGGWTVGDKHQQGVPLMMDMAALGWVCVAPNYPLSPKASLPDHLVDLQARPRLGSRAHRRVRRRPDIRRVTGGSAGGHLAAMLALTPNEAKYQPGFEDADTRVQACVPLLRRLRHRQRDEQQARRGATAGDRRHHVQARLAW